MSATRQTGGGGAIVGTTGRRSVRSRAAVALAAGMAMFGGAACAAPPAVRPAEPTSVALPARAPAAVARPTPEEPREQLSAEARTVRLALLVPDDAHAGRVAAQMRASLAGVGYALAAPGTAADATLRMEVRPADPDSTGEGAVDRVSIQLIHDGVVVAWLVTPLGSEEQVLGSTADLVDRLTGSPALAAVARLASKRALARRLERLAALAPTPTDDGGVDDDGVVDAAQGSAARARRCRNHPKSAACGRVAGALLQSAMTGPLSLR